jgi:hypothetical protein
MLSTHRLTLFLSACVAGGALAGCAPQTQRSLPATTSMRQPATSEASISPPPCKGQQTTKQYATVEEQLQAAGGKICVPAFGGFGGKIAYPNVNPSIGVTITTSTTNYDKMPNLGGSGTPILYIQLSISGATSFGETLPHGGALLGAGIIPAQTYTAFGQASAFGFKQNLTPCYARAGKSTYGGKLGGFGKLLEGQSAPSAATAVVEIYPGKQASLKC